MLFYKTSMALSLSFPPNLFTSSSSSSSFLISQTRTQSSNSFRTSCSYQKIEVERETPKRNQVAYKVPKKKRKLRPSFYEQVRERWSLKNPSQRLKLPWEEKEEEEQQQQQDEDEEEEGEEEEEEEGEKQQQSSSVTLDSLEDKGKAALIDNPVKFGLGNRLAAPWVQKSKLRNTHVDSETKIRHTSEEDEEVGEKLNDLNKGEATWVQTSKPRKTHFISETKSAHNSGFDEDDEVREKLEKTHFISETKSAHTSGFDEGVKEKLKNTHFISETKSAPNSGFNEDEEVREKLEKTHFISETKIAQNTGFDGDKEKKLKESKRVVNSRDGNSEEKKRIDGFLVSVDKNDASSSIGSVEKNLMQLGQDFNGVSLNEKQSGSVKDVVKVADLGEESSSIRLPWENINVVKQSREKKDVVRSVGLSDYHDSVRLPWEKANERDLEYLRKDKWTKNHTEKAEKLIPEKELKRLRNVALRMKERIKVGAAGVTQPLVDCIHEKWKLDEVVKFKFEGPPAQNMMRMHETLERRTGGLVIWRSGSSLVLFRGLSYKLPCVQSYAKETDVARDVAVSDSDRTEVSSFNYSVKAPKDPSAEEIMELSELNDLLDELGPRFRDWTGVDPQPVDADLLPGVIPNYVRPFRLLPHGMRLAVRNKEMTSFRRLARRMRPHFALGRSRELQGLAKAMVKLWERSSIAKIAIKRGVLNTNNERMAEELQKLTGGTLVSRNKEYIVFYRGKDFLPPEVTRALVERQKLAEVRQDEEEEARQRASTFIVQNSKTLQGPLVAGTLAETLAADTRWASQPNSKDMEKMKRDLELAKHASLVRYLERKLSIAQAKVRKAERALGKVQQYLKPTDLPTDLETITDEERFLFRKMGLTMRPFLHVGKRGVFDGTVENMHLHWKYRELVKLIVRGKGFPQVKHIAINLEAESGGLLISLDKTTKGYVIIIYRGKNYQRPNTFRPKNLLTKRQALARSIELQRREALNHHIANLTENIEMMKSELNRMEAAKEKGDYYSKLNDAYYHNDEVEDEGEEAYLETYDMGDENQDPHDEEAGLTSSENQDPHDLK